MESHIIDVALVISIFLVATSLLQVVTRKLTFLPYTVALLLIGFIAQFIVSQYHLEAHYTLSPDLIFYFLLPALLFEASMHINVHQFKIQFKTITFFATIGLMLSVFTVGFMLMYLLGLPFGVALLFGAIISSTDPIAVLALFKSLGAPKRLALLADGESMFNDATGVIAFRIISAFVVTGQAFSTTKVLGGFGSFMYVFIGSIIFGAVLGYVASNIFARVKYDRILLVALTTGLALFSFAGAEHFLGLSGVISTVITGIVFGTVGRAKIPTPVAHFISEFWEYIGFLSLSLVFFFASFNLDLELFSQNIGALLIAIGTVLIARSVSVYVSSIFTNKLWVFNNEPNIPVSWQHILNWGGLRGVIPLVLVYSLPDTFEYKQLMLQFTLATLVFTLMVNGLTVKRLLLALNLHLPRKEEQIIEGEMNIFEIEEMKKKLSEIPKREFDSKVITSIKNELQDQEDRYRKDLERLASSKEFLHSLKIQSLEIERDTMRHLYENGRFREAVLHEFDSDLDVQQDSLEYPDIYTRGVDSEGRVISRKSFRKQLITLRKFVIRYRLLSKLLNINEQDIVTSRYSLLRARLLTSFAVLDYLDRVTKIIKKKGIERAVKEVRKTQEGYIDQNKKEIGSIAKQYPEVVRRYQENVVRTLILRGHTIL